MITEICHSNVEVKLTWRGKQLGVPLEKDGEC